MKTPKHSGFEYPISGVIIPKEYRIEKDENGLIHYIAPKGAEIPEELKGTIEEEK